MDKETILLSGFNKSQRDIRKSGSMRKGGGEILW